MDWDIDAMPPRPAAPALIQVTANETRQPLPRPPTMCAQALPLPAGRVERRLLDGDPGLAYFVYRPQHAAAGAPMLVTVHGISRNARQHARLFAPFAEHAGVVVVSPLFARERFPAHQRLGRNVGGEDPSAVLERIVAEAARLTGADGARLYLFGYSGGGQFVHRYVLAHPERVGGYVIGAAGWYTFPDARRRYPYGLGRNAKLDVRGIDLPRFLAVPGCVLVGERDVHRGTALRSTERLAREQGASRIERGERWVEAMNAAAAALGMPPRLTFETLPRSAHSFRRSMRRGGMGERVFRYLFGLTPAAVAEACNAGDAGEGGGRCIVPIRDKSMRIGDGETAS